MYFLIGRMLPADATVMYNANDTSAYALLAYVVYVSGVSILLFYSIVKLMDNVKIEKSLTLMAIILLSNVFIFGVLERGNSTVLVCILLINALYLRNRESNVAKELALVFIAVAAGIKMYPAVFGILYLIEKRWKEAARLMVYGILGFILPFSFFGGVDGMMAFFNNQKIIQEDYIAGGCTSIKTMWIKIATDRLNLSSQFDFIGNVLVVIFIVMAIVGAVFTCSQWKRVFLLSAIMVVGPFWSGFYTVIYMCIPLILFVKEEQKSKLDYMYAVGFAAIFSFLTFNPQNFTGLTGGRLGRLVIYGFLYIMTFQIIGEAIAGKIGHVQNK
jgi:lysylphosphatidylglycerol synthetase-like protein (DUF2156 family)